MNTLYFDGNELSDHPCLAQDLLDKENRKHPYESHKERNERLWKAAVRNSNHPHDMSYNGALQ